MLLAGMAVFGSATPVSKLVGQAFPPLLAGLLRAIIGTTLLAALSWSVRAQVLRIGRDDWLRIAAISVFGMFGFSALMLYGMRAAPGAVGAAIMSMTPAVTAAGAMAFFRDRPSWRKLAAVGLAVLGAIVLQVGGGLSGDGGYSVLWGASLVFGAVCCESAYTLLGQRVAKTVDPVLVASLGAGLSLPLFAIASSLTETWVLGSDAKGWIALLWYGAGTLALGSWLWYRGIAEVSGVTAAAFMGVMPLSALLLSYLLLHEPFRWIHLAGFGIVFAGVVLMSWEHATMAPK
jgi:drug/metabolite transporter (DMT)-like permease